MEEKKKNPGFIEEDFEFFLPIEKAVVERVDKSSAEKLRWIEGLASTDSKDLQGEMVDQGGIDYAYALKYGYFNNDHKPGFENKVGEPTEISTKSVVNPNTNKKNFGLYVKGFLYNNHKVADSIWELLKAQETTPLAKRRVGFSIQGKVKKRQGSKIISCWVQDIAITAAPINTDTWATIVKSLLMKSAWCCSPNSDVCTHCNKDCNAEELQRALSAGYHSINNTNGSAIIPQSFDSDMKKTIFDGKKDIDKSTLVEVLKAMRGISEISASKFADMLFEMAQNLAGGHKDV